MDPKRIHEDAEKMEEQRPKARGLEDDQDSEVIPEAEDELGGWGEYEEGP